MSTLKRKNVAVVKSVNVNDKKMIKKREKQKET